MSPIATGFIQMLKSVTVVFDVILFIVLLYFARVLRWRNEKDRPSVIGFGFMMATIVMSVISILI